MMLEGLDCVIEDVLRCVMLHLKLTDGLLNMPGHR